MKIFLIMILPATLLMAFGCCKSKNKTCPNVLIEKVKSTSSNVSPGAVWEYEYNGQVVYYIPPGPNDDPSQLYNTDCELMCRPDGGFMAPGGDGKCPDFLSSRKNEKLLWMDDRK